MQRGLLEAPEPSLRWPRELLAVLLVAPPVLLLVFEPDGLRHELVHQARSLLAVWVYVMALGVMIQWATDVVSARRPLLLAGASGALAHVALTWAVVLATTLVLSVPLVWTCPGLDGRMGTLLLRGLLLSTAYVLAGRTYLTLVRARAASLIAFARAEQRLADARYAALVARTQPHFLHNALTAAAGLVSRDADAAERVLRDLGSLFREIVSGTERDRVRAADELETARRYLSVQQARFGERLAFEVVLDPLAADEPVPPLVVLPLVENAVMHGLSDGAITRVVVRVSLTRDHVRIAVEDDGPGRGASAHREGTGLGEADLRERLRTLYGDAASLETGPLDASLARPGHRAVLLVPRDED